MMSSVPSSCPEETTGGGTTARGAIVGAPPRADTRAGGREAEGSGLTEGRTCAADRPLLLGAYQHFCVFCTRR